MDGLILVDKPKGWTSFDVVAKVRGVLRADARSKGVTGKIKVGHTGTLDPMATGLLVLAVGKYTKKVPELTKQDKSYTAQVTLGKTSNTDDAEGELTDVSLTMPDQQTVMGVLQSFIGESQQVPPQFSAIKIGGVRSYKVARSGQEVKFGPRNVIIYSITDIKYKYPTVTFTAQVGSGTYIRSLARDLGHKLGTGAYLSDLRRTKVGEFDLESAVTPENISSDVIIDNLLA